jgi:hypothetical protein
MRAIDTTLAPESIAADLIATFRTGQYAIAKIGDVEVRISETWSNPPAPEVKVNWPGIGEQRGKKALSFAADLTRASLIALLVEDIIAAALDAEATEGA